MRRKKIAYLGTGHLFREGPPCRARDFQYHDSQSSEYSVCASPLSQCDKLLSIGELCHWAVAACVWQQPGDCYDPYYKKMNQNTKNSCRLSKLLRIPAAGCLILFPNTCVFQICVLSLSTCLSINTSTVVKSSVLKPQTQEPHVFAFCLPWNQRQHKFLNYMQACVGLTL